MLNKFFNQKFQFIFFGVYFFIGLLIYKDFGIGIEEHFQRKNGFYWLTQFLVFFELDNFSYLASNKYQEILFEYPSLPDPNFFNFYGIIFDLPLAFIEILFSIEDSKIYFHLRHLSIFLIFFLSSISFYQILKKRFNKNSVIFLGVFFYIGAPRIFGDSFHNNKDILFLSLLTLSIYFLFRFFTQSKNKHLILFCLFSALATSSRIMGVYLPIFTIIFLLIEYLKKKNDLSFLVQQVTKIIFFYLFFLYLHYPYIWELNIFEFSSWFKKFFYWMNIKVLFDGEYYSIKYLPRTYLPFWIFITTPFVILFFSILGFSILAKRFFVRLLNIKDKKIINSDFWQSNKEKMDVFILLSFSSFFVYAIFLNVAMLSGWRHFYFLHLFISYFAALSFNHYLNYFRKKIKTAYEYLLCVFIGFFLVYQNIKFHPYQSLYFNTYLTKNEIENFQVDTPSLSRSHALNYIFSKENGKEKIYVANSSWTPFKNGKDMLTENQRSKFIFVGQEFDRADYIYTNYIYKSDEKYNKNYNIPVEFKKIEEYFVGEIKIFTIYKK